MKAFGALRGGLADSVRRGMAWWLAELAALVPARFANRPESAATTLEVSANAATLVLAGRGAGGPVRIAVGGDDPQQDHARVQAAIRRSGRSAVIRLDPSLVLDAAVTLPLNAERSLRPILLHQLDRLVPLPVDAVEFEYLVAGRSAAAKTLDVRLLVATRRSIEDAVALARSLGLSPRAVTATLPVERPVERPVEGGLEGGLEGREARLTLWQANRRAASPVQRRLRRMLEATAIVLLVAAYATYAHRLSRYHTELEHQIALAMKHSAAAREIAARNAQTERALARVQVRRREMDPLMLLDEVTRMVPVSMWVSQLTMRGREIELVGYSPRVSDLITRIESHDVFYNPKFRSPITRSADGESERFDISFEVWVEDGP